MLPHSRNIRFLRALGLCVFTLQAFAFSPAAHASTTEPGVSHPLAIARAARLSNLRYALTFQLSQTAPDIPGTERITFNNTGTGDLALDFRDGSVASATLNANPIPTTLENGHLTLPAAALHPGPNELNLTFTTQSAPAGKAITRYHDRDDNSDYLYTLFVPMDASMAFPCFDQPDLKARSTLSVSMPPNWKVISNTSVAGGTCCGILPGIDGSLTIEGMPLKPLDRWNLIGHLIAMHDPEAPTLLAAERARDHSGEALKYAYAAEAGTPDPAIKARHFDQYLHTSDIQEDWLSQSLRPFNQWNQSALTLPYLTQALDALPQIKRTRKIFFLGAWLSAFLEGQHTPEAETAVHACLAAHPTLDPDLRLKVLEASDALDRTVRIRQRFPE